MISPWKFGLGLNFAIFKSAKALGSRYRNPSYCAPTTRSNKAAIAAVRSVVGT